MQEENTTAILVLMGVPGAGKTSFVNLYKKHRGDSAQGRDEEKDAKDGNPAVGDDDTEVVHVCYDDLIPLERQSALKEEPGVWKELRSKILVSVELRLGELLGADCGAQENEFTPRIRLRTNGRRRRRTLFILDDNNHLSSMRYKIYQIARKHRIGFAQLFFSAELQTAIRLNKQRPDKVPDCVIKRMYASLEAPDPMKNPWEKFSFSIPVADSMDINLGLIDSIVETAFKYPEAGLVDDSADRDRDRVVCSANVVHQADNHLRGLVNKEMLKLRGSSLSKQEMKTSSTRFYEVKQEVLEDLKTGFTKDVVDCVQRREGGSADRLNLAVSQLFHQKLQLSRTDSKE